MLQPCYYNHDQARPFKNDSKIVALAHYSVKEYLTSEQILQSRAARYGIQEISCNEFIAKGCIGYLLQFQVLGSLSNENIQESKLALYAAKFWIAHTKAVAQKAEALNCLIMEFFSTGNSDYLNWARMYNLERPWKVPGFNRKLAKVPAPLYYASLNGLIEIVGLIVLEADVDVNAQGGDYGSALQAASARGHEKIVLLLLDKGAEINAQGGGYGSALQAASARGHKKILELLISKGADSC